MKSGYQTALKVISVIIIILAVLTIIGGIAMAAGSGLLGAAANSPQLSSAVSSSIQVEGASMSEMEAGALVAGVGIFMGVLIIIEGIITLIIGILGVRGANDPRKIGPFRVFAIIGLVFSILEIIALLFGQSDGSSWTAAVISLIETVVCVWLATKIRNQARVMYGY